jgi:hypothetical protein
VPCHGQPPDRRHLVPLLPAGLALALMPGPNNLLSVQVAASDGVGAACRAGLGRLLAFALLLLAAAFGLAAVLRHAPAALALVQTAACRLSAGHRRAAVARGRGAAGGRSDGGRCRRRAARLAPRVPRRARQPQVPADRHRLRAAVRRPGAAGGAAAGGGQPAGAGAGTAGGGRLRCRRPLAAALAADCRALAPLRARPARSRMAAAALGLLWRTWGT